MDKNFCIIGRDFLCEFSKFLQTGAGDDMVEWEAVWREVEDCVKVGQEL